MEHASLGPTKSSKLTMCYYSHYMLCPKELLLVVSVGFLTPCFTKNVAIARRVA